MKTLLTFTLALTVLVAAALPSAFALPGSPLGNANFGAIEITGGLNVLPGPVEPGDVVLKENPLITDDLNRTNWSDVVRFYNINYAGVDMGIAFQMSDGEAGIPDVALYGLTNSDILLPDAL